MEKKVHFKLHKVKKHWVTIAVTGLALGLCFAGLSYASAEEQPTPVNEATVEAIIKEGAIDVEAPATSETTAKPAENTPASASSEAATVTETPTASSEVASAETVSEKPSSEVTNTSSSEAASSETTHSEVSATTSESVYIFLINLYVNIFRLRHHSYCDGRGMDTSAGFRLKIGRASCRERV